MHTSLLRIAIAGLALVAQASDVPKMLLVTNSLNPPVACPVPQQKPGATLAQTNHCTCQGATQTNKEVSCKGPDGKEFKKTQVCWTKKVLETGKDCGMVCDSVYTVCNGTAPGTCN
jgi:hypothetical protein